MSETLFSFDAVTTSGSRSCWVTTAYPSKLVGYYDNGRTDENPRD